jgi:lipoprotein-releasing system permease protein
MFEYFISKRYLKSKHSINFITIISMLSTLGITLGVAALVVVISVFNGFGSIVSSILVNFDPHVTLSIKQDASIGPENVEKFLDERPDINSYSPVVEKKAILINGRNYQILNLKGIKEHTSEKDWGIKTALVKGDLDLTGDEDISEIAMGRRMALRLSCRVGDTIFVSSLSNLEKQAINFAVIPQVRKMVVSGIFETNNKDYDVQVAYTSLKGAQKVFGMKNRITGYEILMNDIDDSNLLKNDLLAYFGSAVKVQTWYDLHKSLYSVMLIERWSAFILLSLIISVATFNILSSLNMSVIEKRKDIGVLRALGTNKKSIRNIFMYEGLLIGIIGTLAGLIIGIIICYLQIEFKIYELDPRKYIIDAIPIEIRSSDLIIVSAASLILSFMAAYLPSKRASGYNVAESIKYE